MTRGRVHARSKIRLLQNPTDSLMTLNKNISPPDPGRFHDPKHWRDKAEEARAKAEEMVDDVAREMMQRVADEYERLAEHTELTGKPPERG